MAELRQLQALLDGLAAPTELRGRVAAVRGDVVELRGLGGFAAVGRDGTVLTPDTAPVSGEVIGFADGASVMMLHGAALGIAPGTPVRLDAPPTLHPHPAWLGRVIDAQGRAMARGETAPLTAGARAYPLKASPLPAQERRRLGARLDTGVRLIDTALPLCRGQRVGIFAGSGVGKSTLLGMLARHSDVDVNVIGLIGERGREVNEFIEDTLGPDGLARSVVVVATSDQPPLLKRRAAYLTLALAEYFRDQGQHVLCLLDSVTRFAEAQREIGLAGGEPPTTKAFPPSTFTELAALMERAGPGRDDPSCGDITAIFTVLVQGGDMDEPVADAVRGILDGHVVLERAIAERGRYPAVNLLKSVSRSLPGAHSADEYALLRAAKRLLADYDKMATLIRLGAYQTGADPEVDRAIALHPALEDFFAQTIDEATPSAASFAGLAEIVGAEGFGGSAPAGGPAAPALPVPRKGSA